MFRTGIVQPGAHTPMWGLTPVVPQEGERDSEQHSHVRVQRALPELALLKVRFSKCRFAEACAAQLDDDQLESIACRFARVGSLSMPGWVRATPARPQPGPMP